MTRRKIAMIVCDILLLNASYIIAMALRFEGSIEPQYLTIYLNNAIIITIIKLTVFYFFKLYKSLWEYASVDELFEVVAASLTSNIIVIGYLTLMSSYLPISVYIMVTLSDMMLIGGHRFIYRAFRRFKNNIFSESGSKRVLIVGAGSAGAMVIKELRNHDALKSKPVAIIDDNRKKIGQSINGVPVVGNRSDIGYICNKMKVDEIIISIPSAKRKQIRDIVDECRKTKCRIRILPGVYELIDGKVSVSKIRDVDIDDLLGREETKLNMEDICGYIKGKKILVTGGGGSIGSELCRQIARFLPGKLIILDMYENNAYDIQNELKKDYKNLNLKIIISSVRDKKKTEEVIRNERPDVIFHAAAYKHVPLMEENPIEAVKNNIFGTLNVVQAADKYGVKKFVLISTDKAVNPTSVMGATKRVCEKIIQSMDKTSNTEFVAVRFGNVLGSNGSVIPLFKKQIAEGGPVTVTHKNITRYFMTIPEACQLVLQAGSMAKGGEIFVLDMGEPIKIVDLARDLIRLSGFEPETDIPIKIIGLRPGEKLFEEFLLNKERVSKTEHDKIYIEKPLIDGFDGLNMNIQRLRTAVEMGTNEQVMSLLKIMVPTYKTNMYNDDKYMPIKDEVAVTLNQISSHR